MGLYDSVKYKTNFLDQVIVRFDFRQFIDSKIIFKNEIEQLIQEDYPNKGKTQIIRFNSINVTFNAINSEIRDTNGDSQEGEQCEYSDSNMENKLVLSNKYLVFDVRHYTSFEDLIGSIRPVIEMIFEETEVSFIRTGIRYINIFDPDHIRLRKSFFSKEIAESLVIKSIDKDNPVLVRSNNLKEYRDESEILNFRYGMYNPDYPNALRKKNFVLDYDCFTQEIIENKNAAIHFLEKGHDTIQLLYESAITDSLRGVMGFE